MTTNKEELQALLDKHAEVITHDEYEVFSSEVSGEANILFEHKYGVRWSPDERIRRAGAANAEEFNKAISIAIKKIREKNPQEPGEFPKPENEDEKKAFEIYKQAAAFDFDALEIEAEAQHSVSQAFGYYLPKWVEGSPDIYKFKKGTPEEVLELFRIASDAEPIFNGFNRHRIMSMSAAQIIDRAARGLGGWIRLNGKLPRYEDARSGHFVEYLPSETDPSSLNDETLEKIHQQVMDLNPRTADVWRLVTARALEAWQIGQLEPPAVWLDVREVAKAMGYTEHVNGGMKPEHLFEVSKSIKDLESFHITIPIGEKVLDVPDKKGKRKSQRLQAARHSKVLIKVAWDDVRDMFGHSYPLRWKLKPGEWIQLYPRQFAPLFKVLVEMPAKAGKYMWAKSIGTELAYYYRQDQTRAIEKVLKVSTILERACLIDEAKKNRKKGRVREYFEEAMDLLQDSEVCHGWEYCREDINAVEKSYRGWFDTWLEARVHITAPEDIVMALPKVNAK